MRWRTCLRSPRSESNSSRITPADLRAASRSATAASRSARNCATSSAARRMRSSRLARGSSPVCSSGRALTAAVSMKVSLRRLAARRVGLVHKRLERGGILQGHIGEDLAIQIHTGLLEPVHEAAIGCAGGLAGGADPHDPEGAEIALLEAAAFVAVAQRFLDGFLRRTVQLAF